MRTYEVIFIIRPDIADDEADKLVEQMEGVITNSGGKIRKTDRIGRKRLAYMVGRFREGIYVLLDVECDGKTIHEVERRLKVTEPVIKYQSVRTDEELKRAAKLARFLVAKDITVVSGLAEGIDHAAHTAAIEAQGRTIAVIGTPLASAYPAKHRDLQARLMQDHLVVSQFPVGYPTTRRNRGCGTVLRIERRQPRRH